MKALSAFALVVAIIGGIMSFSTVGGLSWFQERFKVPEAAASANFAPNHTAECTMLFTALKDALANEKSAGHQWDVFPDLMSDRVKAMLQEKGCIAEAQ